MEDEIGGFLVDLNVKKTKSFAEPTTNSNISTHVNSKSSKASGP